MKPLAIQFSGGRTSAFMTKFLFELWPDREKHVPFENTGKEDERTLEFVNECDKRWNLGIVWLEAIVHQNERKSSSHKIVSFETAARDGEPYEAVIKKYGIQNRAYQDCTRHLKIHVKNSYIKSLGITDYETAIGIRADEEDRINRETATEEGNIYPLVDIIRVNKKFVRDWWSRQAFDLQTPEALGNCDFCYKKPINLLVSIVRTEPHKLDWWQQMEAKHGSVKAPIAPRKIFRGHRSAQDLRELAAVPTLFDNPEFEVGSGCICQST
jgi:hypothetical protein